MSETNHEWNMSAVNGFVLPGFVPSETSCGTLDEKKVYDSISGISNEANHVKLYIVEGQLVPLVPLTRESGIFRIIGLADQS